MRKKILLSFILFASSLFSSLLFAAPLSSKKRYIPNIPENPEIDFDYELLEDDTVKLTLKSYIRKANVRFPEKYQDFPVTQVVAELTQYEVSQGVYDYYVKTLVIPEGVLYARVNGGYGLEWGEYGYCPDYPELDLYLPDSLEVVDGLNGFTFDEFPIRPENRVEFKHHICAAHIKNITLPKDYGYKKSLQPAWKYEYDLFSPIAALVIDNISWQEGGEVCSVPTSMNWHINFPKSAKVIFGNDNVYRYTYARNGNYSVAEFLPDSIIAINYSYKNYLLKLPGAFKGTLKLEKKLNDLEKAFDSDPEVQELLYSTIW